MYKRDMPETAEYGWSGPDEMVRVITFVLLTIQQPFQQVAAQMTDVDAVGYQSKYLFGSKRTGYAYAVENASEIFTEAQRLADADDRVGAIELFARIPGLGCVKAAFVCQLLGFETACLDTHNLGRLGITGAAFKWQPNAKPETVLRKITHYVTLCDAEGTSEYWWNTWCSFVAGRRNSPLKTADQVSAFHVSALVQPIQ